VLASDGGEVGLDAVRARVGAAMDADLIAAKDEVAEDVGGRHGGEGYGRARRRLKGGEGGGREERAPVRSAGS
jgi:hypothetical protein